MKCRSCENEARGVCKFCGSAVCADHMGHARFVSGVAAQGEPGVMSLPQQWYDFVVTEDAIWCGRCRIEPHYKG